METIPEENGGAEKNELLFYYIIKQPVRQPLICTQKTRGRQTVFCLPRLMYTARIFAIIWGRGGSCARPKGQPQGIAPIYCKDTTAPCPGIPTPGRGKVTAPGSTADPRTLVSQRVRPAPVPPLRARQPVLPDHHRRCASPSRSAAGHADEPGAARRPG